MKSLVIIQALCLLACLSAYCNGKPGANHTNPNPIWKDKPRLLKVGQYGKLYEIGEGTTTIKLLHAYGNMYQMGLAQGELLKNELRSFISQLWEYIASQADDSLPKWLPDKYKHLGVGKAIGLALDLTYYATRKWTNSKYYQEMKGVADASGVDFKVLRRIHMIGQLTKGHCSMFGAWGEATKNGQVIQLRALDWDFDGPYRKYPLVTVYHPSSKKDGNAWVNIGFAGWLGVLSGVSQQQMAVSEIGVSYPDQSFGKESRFGNPFTFLLRDVLQFDKSIDDTIHRMKTTRRTCNLILGAGDGKAGYVRSFQYGHSVLNVINDTDPLPKNDTWHPAVKNTIYHGMDWLCPSFTQRLGQLLRKNHGNITAQLAVSQILPSLTSGNLQAAIYDLTNQKVYFAYGYIDSNNHHINAYDRPYIHLDLKQMFSTQYKD